MSEQQESSAVEPAAPQLLVLTPDATPEQVAAVVAVFSAMAGGEPEPAKPKSQWAAPARRMRTPLLPGRDAWRASALLR